MAVHIIILNMVWVQSGNGLQNCLRFLECWLACLELVQLHRSMVLLPLQIIFLMQTVRILPLPCLDMTTLGQLLFAAC